jgi:hypothetical protein
LEIWQSTSGNWQLACGWEKMATCTSTQATAHPEDFFMRLAKSVGKVCLGLATGGMCLNPALAQEVGAKAPTSNLQQPTEKSADKEVTLAPDGSFRIAVLTRAGSLVPGANVAITSRRREAVDPFKTVTGSRGLTTVSRLTAGLYRVHVDSPQGTYDGTLLVRSAPVANVSLVPPPLVTLMLSPSQPPDQEEERRRAVPIIEELEAGEEAGGPGLLLPALGAAGLASAIALPIALSHHHHHRASP